MLKELSIEIDALEIDPDSVKVALWRRGRGWDTLSLPSDTFPLPFLVFQFIKLDTIITKMNSIKQTKKAIFPVRVDWEEQVHVLWCTEIERYGLGTRGIAWALGVRRYGLTKCPVFVMYWLRNQCVCVYVCVCVCVCVCVFVCVSQH